MSTIRPTDFVGKFKRIAMAAFDAGREAIDRKALQYALSLKNYHGVEEALDGPVLAIRRSLESTLAPALAEVRDASGRASYSKLLGRLRANGRLRAAADVEVGGFDKAHQAAIDWVREHTGETIDSISETTRQEIRALIEQAFVEQFDIDELTDRIEDVIGDEERAEEIARTETMEASNEGQQEAWDQAVEDGLLTGEEQQEWIVTPDDRLCPECEPFDGAIADLGGNFMASNGDSSDGPPLHPRCRCTIGLVLP